VTAPNLIRKVEPVYPREALTQRLGGTVTLTASIAEDGTVREIKVLSGQPLLAEAAVAAVRQWRYSPCLLNGKPVSVEKPITIIFKTP
jgi:TonB family protein